MPQVSRLEVGEEGGPQLSPEQLQALDKKATEYEITLMEETLKQMTPNMAAIAEYKEKVTLCVWAGQWSPHTPPPPPPGSSALFSTERAGAGDC